LLDIVGDPHPERQKFIRPRIRLLSMRDLRIDQRYQAIYDEHDDGGFEANCWLRDRCQKAAKANPKIDRLENLGIQTQAAFNQNKLGEAWLNSLFDVVGPFLKGNYVRPIAGVVELAECLADRWSRKVSTCTDDEFLLVSAAKLLGKLSIDVPNGLTPATRLMRLQDPAWWKRKLGEVLPRKVDQVFREAGRVNKTDEAYVSDTSFEMFKARQAQSRRSLEDLVAVNDVGQEFPLLELIDKSVSNPAIKRTELMVRMRGLEEWSVDLGYSASFITITAPPVCQPDPRHSLFEIT